MESSEKKACVTGAAGYLGAALSRRLVTEGWKVTGLDISPLPQAPSLFVKAVRGDVRDRKAVRAAVEGNEVVFHLAGLMPQARASPEKKRAVNVGGTRLVLEEAVRAGVRRVVFLSSAEVYGRWKRVPAREEDAEPVGEYGQHKLEAEEIGRRFHEKEGIAFIALRPSTIVGPCMTDPYHRKMLNMLRYSPILFWLGGNQRFQMSALEDVVEACLLSASSPVSCGAFNIGSDNPLPVRKLLQEVARALGWKKPVVTFPPKAAKATLRFLDLLGLGPVPRDHYEVLDSDIWMDCRLAKERLGWQPKKENVQMLVEALGGKITRRKRK